MNRILTALVESYAEEFDAGSNSKAGTFESFSAYSILENQASVDVNPQDHLLGGGNDIGIDTAAIVINGKPVTGVDEIDKIAEISPEMRISFVFIQATTSESIDTKKIRKFGDGVRSILRSRLVFQKTRM